MATNCQRLEEDPYPAVLTFRKPPKSLQVNETDCYLLILKHPLHLFANLVPRRTLSKNIVLLDYRNQGFYCWMLTVRLVTAITYLLPFSDKTFVQQFSNLFYKMVSVLKYQCLQKRTYLILRFESFISRNVFKHLRKLFINYCHEYASRFHYYYYCNYFF